MSKDRLRASGVLEIHAGWLAVAAGLVGCRDYTCVDTATCTYASDAAMSEARGDGGSPPDAHTPIAPTASASHGHDGGSEDTATQKPAPDAAAPVSSISSMDAGSGPVAPVTSAEVASSSPTSDLAPSPPSNTSLDTGLTDSMSTDGVSDAVSSVASGIITSSGGNSGGDDGAVPSAGCGKANPATGSSSSPLNVSNHQYYVKLPQDYDPNTPYPVVIMFNPTGNPISWAESAAGFETAAADWIRVYPHMANQASGWGANEVAFFAPFHDKITSDYCMDTKRIFAAGESSGGDFVGILGCEHADKLRGVAPCATKVVRGFDIDAGTLSCTGQVNAIVIHGQNDSVVGPANGPRMRDFYRDLNHCDDTSVPVDGYSDTLSNCVKYEGCDEGYDTYWCSHTDPSYNDTNHGWPAFAAGMLVETWRTL